MSLRSAAALRHGADGGGEVRGLAVRRGQRGGLELCRRAPVHAEVVVPPVSVPQAAAHRRHGDGGVQLLGRCEKCGATERRALIGHANPGGGGRTQRADKRIRRAERVARRLVLPRRNDSAGPAGRRLSSRKEDPLAKVPSGAEQQLERTRAARRQ